MRLRRFKAEGIHGFLGFNIRFHDDLTFLTGINGSGKTSALNSMIALISPDLAMLADLEYSWIEVELENNGSIETILARSDQEQISLSCSAAPDENFVFTRYVPDNEAPNYRQNDGEIEYYRDLLSSRASHPVLKAIGSLPNPMFLGIDRRSSFGMPTRSGTGLGLGRQTKYGRNVFSKSLSGSLAAATRLAEDRYRDALIQSGRFAERLQREMLLGLLSTGPEEISETTTLRLPSLGDVREIQRVRGDLDSIADIMRLPAVEVRKRLIPLLDLLQSLADRIPAATDLAHVFKSERDNTPIISAIAGWSANQIHLQRIKLISEKVANYNELKSRVLEPTRRYQDLVNGFLGDSGKAVTFGDDGYIGVEIDGADGIRPISSLSSGEAQIFVILTHLAFNPAAERNNVFIIDEPELSLHVQWQEMFVDSILSANPNIQYIMATHSPSIILERVDHCKDISRKKKKGASNRRADGFL